jgi:Na+/melibiose symporter-like transporter
MSAPRDLRLLSGAVLLSAAGDLLMVVVLSLRVHDLTGSGFAVAAVFATLMAPVVLLAPLAGRLVDRTETRRLLLAVSLAQALVAGALVFAGGLAPILVLTTLLGAGAALAGPAEASLVPAVAAAGDTTALSRANGWVETARYAGFTVGPLAASVLTATGGTRAGLAANAASFACVAAAAALMRVRREPAPDDGAAGHAALPGRRQPRRGAGSPATALRPRRAGGSAAAGSRRPRLAGGGLALLAADPVLRVAVGAAVAGLLFISASMTVEVFYVRDVVGVGGGGFALVFAAWTGGMVAGAIGVAPRVRVGMLAAGGLLALAVQGGGMAAAACWPVLAWVMAGYLVGGVGHGVKNVLLRTLIQERVASAAHGRAFAAYNAARNTAELGALALGGLALTLLGAQTALLLAGLGPVAAGLVGLGYLGYRPSSAAALSRRSALATSAGSPSASSSDRQASGSNIG